MKCPTCDRDEARHTARLGNDTWPSCTRCKAQGEACSTRVTYTPLDEPDELERPHGVSWDPT